MDRLRLIWRNIGQLDSKRKTVIVVFVFVITATWLSVCVLLFSALVG
jgi:hypothetical protein